MSLPALVSRLSCLVALGAALATPVHAEGNRLLPFWGQPYPTGYAWTGRTEAALTPVALRRNRCRTIGVHGRGRSSRCHVVLHALD